MRTKLKTKLKIAIVTSGLYQYEVASKTGMHESLLSMYVQGRRTITKKHLRALAKVLKMTQSALVTP